MLLILQTIRIPFPELWLSVDPKYSVAKNLKALCARHRWTFRPETSKWEIPAETAKAKAAGTVIDPIDVYIEVAGGKCIAATRR
jgi:hypothetical protein